MIPMFVIDRETVIAVRKAYLSGGRDRAAAVVCERWRGLDHAAALMTVDEVLCWRVDLPETAGSGNGHWS
ncbi:MAG: hypothetical protein HQL37_04490 [Alphaproteobacteria bacterium]|nr:hypothetical protein [Alphaproteobacteria bacterium]